MKVYLAGYNLDSTTIAELKEGRASSDQITPETISAAYARISRDPRPVNELREIARTEVEKSRKSNERIVFGMGHSSVAEHTVFNFDVLDISRLAIEALEHFRIASFTEKSQRYITLENDFVLPQEIQGTKFEPKFKDVIKEQNALYHEAFEKLKERVFKENPELAKEPKNKSLLEGWAKEDARYVVSLATHAQLGMTVNARSLEYMLRSFAAHELAEVREMGDTFFKEVESIAPSLVKYTAPTDYEKNTYQGLKKYAETLDIAKTENAEDVKIVRHTKNADDFLTAVLLHSSSNSSFEKAEEQAKQMTIEEKREFVKTAVKDLKFFNSVLREYEYPDFTFEIKISASCFAQLKRHRMATITCQPYTTEYFTPPSIVEAGLKKKYDEVMEKTNFLYSSILAKCGNTAQYILTNAHKKRLLMKLNAREMYHFSRLREDSHAQRDIRDIAAKMSACVREVAPLTGMLLAGKDKYQDVYASVYGK